MKEQNERLKEPGVSPNLLSPPSSVASPPGSSPKKKRKPKSPWAYGRPKTHVRKITPDQVQRALEQKEERRREASRTWLDSIMAVGEGVGTALSPYVEPLLAGFEDEEAEIELLKEKLPTGLKEIQTVDQKEIPSMDVLLPLIRPDSKAFVQLPSTPPSPREGGLDEEGKSYGTTEEPTRAATSASEAFSVTLTEEPYAAVSEDEEAITKEPAHLEQNIPEPEPLSKALVVTPVQAGEIKSSVTSTALEVGTNQPKPLMTTVSIDDEKDLVKPSSTPVFVEAKAEKSTETSFISKVKIEKSLEEQLAGRVQTTKPLESLAYKVESVEPRKLVELPKLKLPGTLVVETGKDKLKPIEAPKIVVEQIQEEKKIMPIAKEDFERRIETIIASLEEITVPQGKPKKITPESQAIRKVVTEPPPPSPQKASVTVREKEILPYVMKPSSKTEHEGEPMKRAIERPPVKLPPPKGDIFAQEELPMKTAEPKAEADKKETAVEKVELEKALEIRKSLKKPSPEIDLQTVTKEDITQLLRASSQKLPTPLPGVREPSWVEPSMAFEKASIPSKFSALRTTSITHVPCKVDQPTKMVTEKPTEEITKEAIKEPAEKKATEKKASDEENEVTPRTRLESEFLNYPIEQNIVLTEYLRSLPGRMPSSLEFPNDATWKGLAAFLEEAELTNYWQTIPRELLWLVGAFLRQRREGRVSMSEWDVYFLAVGETFIHRLKLTPFDILTLEKLITQVNDDKRLKIEKSLYECIPDLLI